MKNPDLRLIFFGGKGGVGKTTMAATTALLLSRLSGDQKKILIVSTDPAHSLSDSFGIEIGDRVTSVKGTGGKAGANLYARELDSGRLLKEFQEKNHNNLQKLAERGTFFDQEDIADFLDLSLPGMDEVMAIMEMARLLRRKDFHTLVVDTAPTGHTLRMLELPGQMKKWIEVMDLMQQKHRTMFRHFTGKKYVKDECDLFLESLASDITSVQKMLRNPGRTRFVPVLIPEMMSVNETKRLVASLEKTHIPVRDIIVNRVAESDGCPFCMSRVESQKQAIDAIDTTFSHHHKIPVPLFPDEIYGMHELKQMADYLSGLPLPETDLKPVESNVRSAGKIEFDPGLDFFIFGGKGGVGKTTLASAAALHLAHENPDKKILLFSTDPAHSLSDVFDMSIGSRITPIHGAETTGKPSSGTNLFALEINPEDLWNRFKETFKQDVKDLFDHFLGGRTDIRFDRQVMTEMLEMAPPGLDEIMALDHMVDLRQENQYDIFVLDTSPSGHLMRFLELPHLVREWLRVFFRLLMKYKGVVRLNGAAEKALNLSRNVRKIQGTLVDPEKTRFMGVTIAERMGLLEIERLMQVIEKTNLPCEHIIVNMILPETHCGFCSSKRSEQQGCLQEIHSRFRSQSVVHVPLFSHAVGGMDHLKKINDILFIGKQA
ncbi:MAG: ArsA family ATPase [Deltaproteobacteria bacterium]|nr:ArsA family ATPase [Deltaproteobacteria bacterium]